MKKRNTKRNTKKLNKKRDTIGKQRARIKEEEEKRGVTLGEEIGEINLRGEIRIIKIKETMEKRRKTKEDPKRIKKRKSAIPLQVVFGEEAGMNWKQKELQKLIWTETMLRVCFFVVGP